MVVANDVNVSPNLLDLGLGIEDWSLKIKQDTVKVGSERPEKDLSQNDED